MPLLARMLVLSVGALAFGCSSVVPTAPPGEPFSRSKEDRGALACETSFQCAPDAQCVDQRCATLETTCRGGAATRTVPPSTCDAEGEEPPGDREAYFTALKARARALLETNLEGVRVYEELYTKSSWTETDIQTIEAQRQRLATQADELALAREVADMAHDAWVAAISVQWEVDQTLALPFEASVATERVRAALERLAPYGLVVYDSDRGESAPDEGYSIDLARHVRPIVGGAERDRKGRRLRQIGRLFELDVTRARAWLDAVASAAPVFLVDIGDGATLADVLSSSYAGERDFADAFLIAIQEVRGNIEEQLRKMDALTLEDASLLAAIQPLSASILLEHPEFQLVHCAVTSEVRLEDVWTWVAAAGVGTVGVALLLTGHVYAAYAMYVVASGFLAYEAFVIERGALDETSQAVRTGIDRPGLLRVEQERAAESRYRRSLLRFVVDGSMTMTFAWMRFVVLAP